MNKIKKIVIIIILMLFCVLWYLYYENNYLIVKKYEIHDGSIPSNFQDYQIAHISDYHNTKSEKIMKDLLYNLEKENIDIIVITGDLIDSRNTNTSIAIDLVHKLTKIAPVYYVSGNHEARSCEYDELELEIKKNGVIVLNDTTSTLSKNGDAINIIGIVDYTFKEVENSQAKGYTTSLLSKLVDKTQYNILLSHRPELINSYVELEINLVFSGHAHGGQIRIPFIGGIIAPNQGMFPKLTSGIHREKNTNLVISKGIGNSVFPYRINNRPELIIVKLENKKNEFKN